MKNGNILLVDDEPGSLKLLRDILTLEGHRVRPFNNGELALRSMVAEAPELILLDIRMTGMDGFEVCRRIGADERLKEIPVIFISAALDVEDKVRAFQEGGVDYIAKPFQKEEVVARVATHLALGRSRLEMKRVEAALRRSEQSLKLAQAIAHLGHWELEVATGQFLWSEETYRILGLEPRESPASYEDFLQSVHPDDQKRVAGEIAKVQEGMGTGFDIEYKILLPSGRVRIVHGKGEIVRLGDTGQPTIIGTIQELPESARMTMLGVIQDITEQKELEWQLEQRANIDSLTGCACRRHFLETAERELARTRRYGSELSVLMLDLDYFKAVNDKYGHSIGDATLKKLAEVCRCVLREMDIVGRLGGEEFAILLPETGNEQAVEVAKRLLRAVADTEVPLDGGGFHFTASIGAASLLGDDPGIEMTLKRADQALYEAKSAGRNRVCSL